MVFALEQAVKPVGNSFPCSVQNLSVGPTRVLPFSFGSLGEGKGLARRMVLTSVSSLQLKQAAASAVFSSLLNPKEDWASFEEASLTPIFQTQNSSLTPRVTSQ